MFSYRYSLRVFCLLALFLGCASLAGARDVGPWNQERLFKVPDWEKAERGTEGRFQGILYESVPYDGDPVEVFAYYAAPAGEPPSGGWPAVVCVHGGGGTAFKRWVKIWNDHGYAAISMDLEGHYPVRRSSDKGRGERIPVEQPGPSRVGVFDDVRKPLEKQWYTHAVAQVILGHSLIRSFPEVDSDRIGITGISWGGTITSTVMGVDPRFQFAIPVYGCGFLPHSEGHQGRAIKDGEQTRMVKQYFDGSAYFQNVDIPTFWLNGVNDHHFALPATQKSARAVQGPATVRYELGMGHGHGPGWTPDEIYVFADSIVKDGKPLPAISQPELQAGTLTARFRSAADIRKASLLYTRSTKIWPKREWRRRSARISENTLEAPVPDGATAVFFTITDKRGCRVSSYFVRANK